MLYVSSQYSLLYFVSSDLVQLIKSNIYFTILNLKFFQVLNIEYSDCDCMFSNTEPCHQNYPIRMT